MTRIGYARVSSVGQSLSIQVATLAACDTIYQETPSGTTATRPQRVACLESLHEGDTLVVTRLDRLAGSTYHYSQEGVSHLQSNHLSLFKST